MSIIHDALKKAGDSKSSQALPVRGLFRQNLELEVPKKSKQVNWGPIFVLMVLFLITGPLIAPVFSTTFKRTNFIGASPSSRAAYQVPIETASPPVNTVSENRKAQFGLEEMALNPLGSAPLVAAPRLDLTGIVFSKEGSYCILNAKVLRVGEEVGGAKVTLVEPGLVKLLYQGEEIKLTVPERTF